MEDDDQPPPAYALELAKELDAAGSTNFSCCGSFRDLSTHRLPALQAPFGRGEATIVDTRVRHTWQLGTDKFSIAASGSSSSSSSSSSSGWHRTLSDILDHVCQELGLASDRGRVEAQLYKLLLYEPGSFFAPHQDSEKVAGMFGTLVINLPSDHKGGVLVVRHNGKQCVYGPSLLGAPDAGVSYVAFYADCEHEVKPVTHGYRLCLTYNLRLTGPGPSPSSSSLPHTKAHQVSRLVSLMQQWQEDPQAPPFLAYVLEHKYTDSSAAAGASAFKGNDIRRGQLLQALSAATGAGLALVRVLYHEQGDPGIGDDFEEWGMQAERPYWEDDEGEEEEEEDDGEDERVLVGVGGYDLDVYARKIEVDNWVQLGGEPVGRMVKTRLEPQQLLTVDAFEKMQPEREVGVPTGNEGCTIDRWYRHSAIVIWPAGNRYAVLARSSAGPTQLMGELSTRTDQLLQQYAPHRRRQGQQQGQGQQRKRQRAASSSQQQRQQQGEAVGAAAAAAGQQQEEQPVVRLPAEAAADIRTIVKQLAAALDPKQRPNFTFPRSGWEFISSDNDNDDSDDSDDSDNSSDSDGGGRGGGRAARVAQGASNSSSAVYLPFILPALEGLVQLGLQDEVEQLLLAAVKFRTGDEDIQVLLPFFKQHYAPAFGMAAAAPVLKQLAMQELNRTPDSNTASEYTKRLQERYGVKQDEFAFLLWPLQLSELLLGLLDMQPLQVDTTAVTAALAAAAAVAAASAAPERGRTGGGSSSRRAALAATAAAAAAARLGGGSSSAAAARPPQCMAQMQQLADSPAAAAAAEAVRVAARKLAVESTARVRQKASFVDAEEFAAAFQLLAVLGLTAELQQLLYAMHLAASPRAGSAGAAAAAGGVRRSARVTRGAQQFGQAADRSFVTAKALAPAALAIGAWLGPELLRPTQQNGSGQLEATATAAEVGADVSAGSSSRSCFLTCTAVVGCYRELAGAVCAQLNGFVSQGPPTAADKFVLPADGVGDPNYCQYGEHNPGQDRRSGFCNTCMSARAFLQDGSQMTWSVPATGGANILYNWHTEHMLTELPSLRQYEVTAVGGSGGGGSGGGSGRGKKKEQEQKSVVHVFEKTDAHYKQRVREYQESKVLCQRLTEQQGDDDDCAVLAQAADRVRAAAAGGGGASAGGGTRASTKRKRQAAEATGPEEDAAAPAAPAAVPWYRRSSQLLQTLGRLWGGRR